MKARGIKIKMREEREREGEREWRGASSPQTGMPCAGDVWKVGALWFALTLIFCSVFCLRYLGRHFSRPVKMVPYSRYEARVIKRIIIVFCSVQRSREVAYVRSICITVKK